MADPIDGVYCLNCRQFIPADVVDCPYCGALRGTIPPPAVVAAVRHRRNLRSSWMGALLLVGFLVALGVITVFAWGTASRLQRKYAPGSPTPHTNETRRS